MLTERLLLQLQEVTFGFGSLTETRSITSLVLLSPIKRLSIFDTHVVQIKLNLRIGDVAMVQLKPLVSLDLNYHFYNSQSLEMSVGDTYLLVLLRDAVNPLKEFPNVLRLDKVVNYGQVTLIGTVQQLALWSNRSTLLVLGSVKTVRVNALVQVPQVSVLYPLVWVVQGWRCFEMSHRLQSWVYVSRLAEETARLSQVHILLLYFI